MAKGMKPKKLTFRQRLREAAGTRLDKMIDDVRHAAAEICSEKYNVAVDPALLMQLASQPNQGKTLRNQLITELANEAEAELERIYNDQQKLDLGDDDD